jgi:hypothetical protein
MNVISVPVDIPDQAPKIQKLVFDFLVQLDLYLRTDKVCAVFRTENKMYPDFTLTMRHSQKSI